MSATSATNRTANHRLPMPAHLFGSSDDARRDRNEDRDGRRDGVLLEPHWVAAIEAATD
jgi:hypothetical protein